jgi:MscS family membrane protein
MSLARLALVLMFVFGLHQPAHGACTSPLAATQHFFDNLQKGSGWQPATAIACFPPGEGMEKTAIQLKQVLDAKGLFIDFDLLSTDPEYVNESGEAKQILHKRMPVVYLQKVGDNWLFSEQTVRAVPGL